MLKKSHQTTIFYLLLLMLILSGCYSQSSNKPIALLDKAYIDLNKKDSFKDWKSEEIPDSLLTIYAEQSHENIDCSIKSKSHYKIFLLGKYMVSEEMYGELIYFEPTHNDCYNVQFYLRDAVNHKIVDAVELAYALSEEGITGRGKTYIIANKQSLKLFTRQEWYAILGRWEEEEEIIDIDTMVYHQIKDNKIQNYIPSEAEKKEADAFLADKW